MSIKILLSLLSLLVFWFSSFSFANAATIYQHIKADGTNIIFFQDVRQARSGILRDTDLSIEIHKVFKPDGKNYDAIRIMADGQLAATHDIVSANWLIDGSVYELTPLSGARKDDLPENIKQIWYQFSPELADKLRNAKKMVVCVNFTNGKKEEKTIGGSELQKIKFIASVNDANIAPEHVRPYGHQESFRMFFPGIKPEEIGTGLLYNANHRNGKFNYYRDYYQASFREDWTKFSFEYIKSFSTRSASYPFLLAEMREENNGTVIKLDVLSKTYYKSYPYIEYAPINPKDKLSDFQLWELDMWATRLMSLFRDLHGTYDYGLEWGITDAITEKNTWKRMRKEWSMGPYDVTRINKEQYQELKDINPGDKIIAINGKSTAMLYYPNSIIEAKYSSAPVEFTFRLQDGSEKIIKITPKFTPTTTAKINYLEQLKKHSGQLTKGSVMNGGSDSVFITYDPLGKREF
ncbi:hypothetical protein [Sporomusa sphaeroides]|uniref:PDZ domain-containing protein n=1 Tax=Sporomusa sphaeroides DSM 2875 TaxID=1337886 RepID=A0ABP2CBF7_9FIRM|nr:hypothetical protein [Sporomusa sphaeroides]OLS54853.1 hypothetical protein SPSPH_41860 [Sporomusa sphaeroides DSM 2875]CVK21605.1 hypothetical protein SSPH_04297 [Sporomusa sphaeroides DSM 2875]